MRIYQPQTRNQETPQGLFSWQVFRTEEQARQWLIENGDPEEQYEIIAYDERDIEGYKFVENDFTIRAKELEERLWKIYDEQITLITDCMRERKELFAFSNFDKGNLTYNDDDEELDLDYLSMGTICPYCNAIDVYFIGMEYIETPNDTHNPYRIDVYYIDENYELGVTDLSNVILDSRCVLVELIKNYA